MRSKTELPLSRQIFSLRAIWVFSLASGLAVSVIAIFFQWLIYDDWMHRSGPLRLVGSALAGLLTLLLAFRWQIAIRDRKLEMLRRFETIKRMNDRVRNALQAIECVTYATNPEATDPVRNAIDGIESILHEVLVETRPALPHKLVQPAMEQHRSI
jgi:hypothetical protein